MTNDQQIYSKMINMHHPGHSENVFSSDYTGVSLNIKLRMHPLASVIADQSLDNFDRNNQKIVNKYLEIYKFLNNIKNFCSDDHMITQFQDFTMVFHSILIQKKKIFNWPIIKYNWPIYDNNFLQIEDKKKKL